MTVDTARESALMVLHLACQALKRGECTLAVAGGAAVMVTPAFPELSGRQGLAPDGRCKSFGAGADGTGWGEGAGALVLEKLSDARRNGHRVLAVISGSAVSHAVAGGPTAPNGPSQRRVIRAALASAGLTAADIDAVEAHGAGTVPGDPVEARALIATYGQDRPGSRPLWLGSVKSNIGHSQAAAGLAGVMKMVLALNHGMLPRTLHADEASPRIDWQAGDVRLLTQPVPWPAGERPRRAGVSSLGTSGASAHVIIEEPPAAQEQTIREQGPQRQADRHREATGGRGTADGNGTAERGEAVVADSPLSAGGPTLWVVSGRSSPALAAQAARLARWLAARPDLDPADVAWSLATTRAAFEHRAVVIGSAPEELRAGLAALAADEPVARVITGTVPTAGPGRVGFLFSGQGSQRAGMAAGLYAGSPVFAAVFDVACGLLQAELGVPVDSVALGWGVDDDPRADQALFAQPGLFAVQAGLIAMLAACGLRPEAVAGHSAGEVAAAYAAGVLSLADACRLVAARARLMQRLPGGGEMCAIAASEREVTSVIAAGAMGARVSIAAVNGPVAVVVSGEADAVRAVAARFAGRGVRTRMLRASHAFRPALTDSALDGLDRAAAALPHAAPRIPWAGALDGDVMTDPVPGYWAAAARRPVRFGDAVAALAVRGVRVFIEVGPDATLTALGPAVAGDAVFIPSQRPGVAAVNAVIAALAQAHVAGAAVDWARVLPAGQPAELPTYAFQHQRYWASSTARQRK